MFLNLRELELRKVQFDEDFPAGEIDFDLNQLRQIGPLHAKGMAELLNNTLGEIRVRGHVRVDLELPCDRCPFRSCLSRSAVMNRQPAQQT